ncbi:MAG: ftsH 1, partial [Planctomycetaceae bacterium]|nr:ftsH 1 [Planctomycetaceae bacterium]
MEPGQPTSAESSGTMSPVANVRCSAQHNGAPLPGTLPDWYPAWAAALADMYFSGTTCLFIVHGNVHDL